MRRLAMRKASNTAEVGVADVAFLTNCATTSTAAKGKGASSAVGVPGLLVPSTLAVTSTALERDGVGAAELFSRPGFATAPTPPRRPPCRGRDSTCGVVGVADLPFATCSATTSTPSRCTVGALPGGATPRRNGAATNVAVNSPTSGFSATLDDHQKGRKGMKRAAMTGRTKEGVVRCWLLRALHGLTHRHVTPGEDTREQGR